LSIIKISIVSQQITQIIKHVNELAASSNLPKLDDIEINDIFKAVKASGVDKVSAMVNDLLASPELDGKLVANFCAWLRYFIYMPKHISKLDKMMDDGLIEFVGIHKQGGFIFKPTEKGKKQNVLNIM